ncbi:MAG: KH domain-containing protein [Eubacteriales bacterium]|nr:KH domain-containing protein [Eubacteriales bacterium]
MKELLEVIAKSLVDDPEAVSVTEERTETSINLALRVSDKDIGKVIGKQGRIAKAIRTVIKAAAGMEDLRVNVDILD